MNRSIFLYWLVAIGCGIAGDSGGQNRRVIGQDRLYFPQTLSSLLWPSGAQIEQCDIGLMNLLCAESLASAEDMSVDKSLPLLEAWAKHVKAEMERHLYRFRKNREQFQNSEGYFRMLMMAVVLYEDFGVRYNSNRMSNSTQPRANDGFFADSREVFLHGLLGPRRTGTCSSMPVLYVALGRRLGYPLKLVKAKGHLFARWESSDGRERFNIEATSRGLNTFPDEYYKQWPYPMSEADLRSGHYLRSLTSQEELALFLQTRGHCLKAAGKSNEAKTAYEQARRFAPHWPEHNLLIANLKLN
jgi:hypothetical protein